MVIEIPYMTNILPHIKMTIENPIGVFFSTFNKLQLKTSYTTKLLK